MANRSTNFLRTYFLWFNPHWTRRRERKQNGTCCCEWESVHTGCKQHQRNCLQVYVLACSEDWACAQTNVLLCEFTFGVVYPMKTGWCKIVFHDRWARKQPEKLLQSAHAFSQKITVIVWSPFMVWAPSGCGRVAILWFRDVPDPLPPLKGSKGHLGQIECTHIWQVGWMSQTPCHTLYQQDMCTLWECLFKWRIMHEQLHAAHCTMCVLTQHPPLHTRY